MKHARGLRPTFVLVALAAAAFAPCAHAATKFVRPPKPVSEAEVAIGERLFLETRFSRYFAKRALGDANAMPVNGEPTVATTPGVVADLPGAFAGKSMSCRACHLVDEFAESAGTRTYADFARRSAIPPRDDGRKSSDRNSPGLVGILAGAGAKAPLHGDGEFDTPETLIAEGLLGRNLGWLPAERAEALAHLAHVIREDDGAAPLARRFGGSYATVLAGTDTVIPARLRLPERYRIDVKTASDDALLRRLSELIVAYLRSLDFARDADGAHRGSPYDRFLKLNGIPRAPDAGESPENYARRLAASVSALRAPVFVSPEDGVFFTHKRDFVFGPRELAGLRLFLSRPGDAVISGKTAGNCVACHTPPDFTDFRIHNTGESQATYDDIHGEGAFAAMHVPGPAERRGSPDRWLPPSAAHPEARGLLTTMPDNLRPGVADLGAWNTVANPDRPEADRKIRPLLAVPGEKDVAESELMLRALARFKTPSLRDLDHSAPYMHDGEKDSVEKVVQFYRDISGKARAGLVRNADPELARIRIAPADEAALAAFLHSLDEDYE